ncbi:hypothetical protein WJX73_003270 [Symbiochloris irregularis]|uniref:DUF4149 domain-containing protein n=1 Tax=Symbiochloris irregularis TaxID=706552 RepID=A0AAW1PHY8_9CHLO
MMNRFRGNRQQGSTQQGGKFGTGKALSLLAALVLPLWIFAGGAWIVQVVGLALCQRAQQNGAHFLQFDWFVTAATVAVLLLVPISLITRRSSLGILALLTVVTVLEILRTNVWNDARLARGDVNGIARTQIDSVINPGLNASTKRVQTVFAGYLITSVFNLCLLLGLGSLPAPSAQDARQVENHARVAADEHKAGNGYNSNYNANNGGLANQTGANNGVAHNGAGHV